MERFATFALISGIFFFIFGTFWQGIAPWIALKKVPMKSLEEVSMEIPKEFYMLADEYPQEFKKYFGKPDKESFKKALIMGRNIYIAEGCWHCHTQYVRPVSNEEFRFGKVSYPTEYATVMQLPQLFGTRRVGPDLIRESGRHSNDWHMAHFKNPPATTPGSVMPRYTWFYDENGRPNAKALAITTYVQWLGSWIKKPMYVLKHKEG